MTSTERLPAWDAAVVGVGSTSAEVAAGLFSTASGSGSAVSTSTGVHPAAALKAATPIIHLAFIIVITCSSASAARLSTHDNRLWLSEMTIFFGPK